MRFGYRSPQRSPGESDPPTPARQRSRRRRIGAIIGVSLALVAGSLTAAAIANAEDEVLIANDFEDGTIAPWGARGPVTLEVSSEGHESGQSLSVSGRTADWNGTQVDVTSMFEVGVTYSVTAWVKLPAGTTGPGEGGSAGMHFTVQGDPTDPEASDTFTWVGGNIPTTDGAWVQIGGDYTRPDGLSTITLYIEAAETTPFLVDDILVTGPATQPPGPEPGIVHSSDFEEGLNGWIPREAGEAGHTVTLSTDFAHGGSQSLLVSGRDSQGDGAGVDASELQPAVTYRISAWARFAPDADTDALWFSVASTTGSDTTFSTLGQFATVTNGDWTQITTEFTVPAADSRLLYFETTWSSADPVGNTSDFYLDDIVIEVPPPPVVQDLTPLKDTVDFPVGVAIDNRETVGSPSDLLLKHFNQVTAENHMKPEAWYDAERNFRGHAEAEAVMEYAVQNDLRVYGHVLVWHSQVPTWFFQDEAGEPLTTSAAHQQLLRDRLHDHIFNVAQWLSGYGEFGGGNPVVAFDVVNEVIADSGEFADGLRRSEWYRVLGEEYIHLAFQWADEAFNDVYAAEGADRPVTLFINDYNTEVGGKQDRYLALVQRLLAAEVPVDGVGHQFHVSINTPISTLAVALDRFADLDVVQAVTELDVTVGTPVTQAVLIEQGYYYRDLFAVLRDYSAADPGDLYSVTVWGLTDNRSWRSAQAPLLFDSGLQAKPAYYGAVDGTLPPLERRANVFGGDVALNPNVFTLDEWRQLPAHRVGEAAGFGLRWVDDHLTVLATVASDEATALAFTYGGQELTFAKDGSGSVPGVVNDTGDGWRAVIHLPHTGVTEGSTGEFDLRVLAGDDLLAAWNSPGALGTLSYLEDLSFAKVVAARSLPTVDGVRESLWDDANVVRTEKRVEGSTNAQADVRTLWLDDTLYVLFEVTDPVIDLTSGDPWQQDSVEIFVDAGNAKNGPFRPDDTQIRINVDNVTSFGTGDVAAQAARLTSATSRTETGYIVEASIDLLGLGGLNTFHGVDFQVNDGSPREGQATGARTAVHTWAEPTGTGYQTTARWGVAKLVEPVVPAWAAATVYLEGDLVTYNGSVWMATWWTQFTAPGDPWSAWQEIVEAPDGTAVWTPSRIFIKGDTVIHEGNRYVAKWWTRNQEPGDPYGPWKPVS